MTGKALFNIQNSALVYPLVEQDHDNRIMMFKDLDTDKTFNWFPGRTWQETEKIYRRFGYEIGTYDGND